jgi:hypothetical protein
VSARAIVGFFKIILKDADQVHDEDEDEGPGKGEGEASK